MVKPYRSAIEVVVHVQTMLSSGQLLTLHALCALITPAVSVGVVFVCRKRRIIQAPAVKMQQTAGFLFKQAAKPV